MDPRVQPLAAILRLNTRLLLNCLDGLTDETARARHATGVNSATFIAAHVTDSRFFILRTLGGARENPLSIYLDKAKSIDEVTEWPSLDAIRARMERRIHRSRPNARLGDGGSSRHDGRCTIPGC